MKKRSWRALFTGCYGSSGGSDHLVSNKVVSQKGSIPRLSSSESGSLSLEDLSVSLAGSNLYVFTLEELQMATGGFSSSNFVGEGGFGPVYKGFVDERVRPGTAAQVVAVKLLDLAGSQGDREWLVRSQLEFILHPLSLPWLTRLKIAVGAAKGLAFLHDTERPVIYRDFKASNILLDSDYTVKLSDFGLAKDGPEGDNTHVSTRVMGTQGYAAPEYIMTGHLTAKSDVYSFGVVLLELLTGRRSVDRKRPSREQNLVEWARPFLNDARKLTRIMDPSLDGIYSTKAAQKAAAMAYQCLSQCPKSRPQMSSIVEILEPLMDLNDGMIGPFVFTLVCENFGNDEKEKQDENEKRNFNNGQRHEIQSVKSGIHFDLSVHRNIPRQQYENGIKEMEDMQRK